MKKSLVFIAVAAATLVLAGFSGCKAKPAGDQSLAKVQKAGKIVLGLDVQFPPMGFKDDSGAITGFDIDLAKAVGKKIGVEIECKGVDWDGVIMSLDKGDIDMIWNGLTITEDRKAKIAFTKPYMENHQIIVVQEKSAIADKAGLAKKSVGLQLGSSSEGALDADAATKASLKEVRKYPNNTEALLDLAAGRVDAVVVDEIVGRYYIAKKPGTYKVLDENFGTEAYGVGFRKGDLALVAAIDKALDEIKADGTAAEISKQWFGEDILAK